MNENNPRRLRKAAGHTLNKCMHNLLYISTPDSKKLSLAEKSWQVFSQYVSRYQWALDDPSHSPRASEIAHAILNRGKSGCCTFHRPDGYKYVLPVLHRRHFENGIANRRKIYYVSYGKQALLYLDLDLHYEWQTLADGDKAKQLLGKLMPQLFWATSRRGPNGYLKVDLQGEEYAIANKVFSRLQNALQLYLAHHRNKADFELKGKIGFMNGEYQWAQYGKLPIHSPDWSFARLEEFKAKPTVTLRSLAFLCDHIEDHIPQSVLEQHNGYKRSLGDGPIFKNGYFLVTPSIEKSLEDKHGEGWRYLFRSVQDAEGTWLSDCCYRPGKVPLTESEIQKEKHDARHFAEIDCIAELHRGTDRSGSNGQGECGPRVADEGKERQRHDQRDLHVAGTVAHQRGPINLDLSDLMDEPDSFKRQKEALFRYARYLKRVPTVEEGMQLLHDHRLFSGIWEEHLTSRRIRVRAILNFIARTFDPAKCAKGSVNIGKHDAWAARKFPTGLIGKIRRSLTEEGEIIDGRGVHIGPNFIAVFMAVCEFALVIDKNQDGSVPHNRAKEIWDALFAKGLISVKFCSRKWAVCREEMVRYGVIRISDRDYGPGKAMKWDVGLYFPFLGLWKGTKVRVGLCGKRKERRTRRHNTLLRKQSVRAKLKARLMPARPPPVLEDVPN
jgi:hypothetical protein